ncbi:MAG: arylamine N-acetyltransferase [Bdellovibrio sp.]|nr:arylamine N-acetyltransferase [Bdellovibrio sp.]
MNTSSFPMSSYLKRIGLQQQPPTNLTGLKDLVQAHSFSIAFENLDVLADIPILYSLDQVIEKILNQGRGGYCFEVNGLLSGALDSLGFKYRKLMARVSYGRPTPGPKTHLVFAVDCDNEEWFVDVGFGGPGLTEPALFRPGLEFTQNGATYRFVEEPHNNMHLQRKIAGKWEGLYIISQEPILPIDIEVANHFVSTWGRSPFRSIFMCLLPTSEGLVTLQATDLIHLNEELVPTQRTPLRNADDLKNTMKTIFKIDVPTPLSELAWNKVNR